MLAKKVIEVTKTVECSSIIATGNWGCLQEQASLLGQSDPWLDLYGQLLEVKIWFAGIHKLTFRANYTIFLAKLRKFKI